MRFPLLLSLVGVLNAASYTVETSTVCDITTNHWVVNRPLTYGTDGCRAVGADGSFAEAEADVYVFSEPLEEGGINLSVNVAGGVSVHLADTDPDIEVTRFDHEAVKADMSAEVTLFLATGGPRRPGVLQAELHNDHGGRLEYSVPGGFELGTPFEMSLSFSIGTFLYASEFGGGYTSVEDRWRGGFGGQSFRFPRVYESDGVTPVALFWQEPASQLRTVDNPEPGTVFLLGLGLSVVAAAKRIRKRKQA